MGYTDVFITGWTRVQRRGLAIRVGPSGIEINEIVYARREQDRAAGKIGADGG